MMTFWYGGEELKVQGRSFVISVETSRRPQNRQFPIIHPPSFFFSHIRLSMFETDCESESERD